MTLLSAEGETPEPRTAATSAVQTRLLPGVETSVSPAHRPLCYLGTVQDLSVCLLSKGYKREIKHSFIAV